MEVIPRPKPGKMTGLSQTLEVYEWPLHRPGDFAEFGAIVAIGVFPDFDKGQGFFNYADFASGSKYARFRMPDDRELIMALFHILKVNMDRANFSIQIRDHIRITLTSMGHHHAELIMK